MTEPTPSVKVDPELLRYWRTFPAPSNEVLACDLIESLQRELSLAQSRLAEVEKLLAEALPRIGRFVVTTHPPIKLPPDTLADRIQAALKRSSASSQS